MSDKTDEESALNRIAVPTPEEREKERQRRLDVAEEMRVRMEAESLRVRDLILAQPPIQLLGYLWAHFHMEVWRDLQDVSEAEYRPNKEVLEKYQFALEYVHAAWSSAAELADSQTSLDETKADELLQVLEELKGSTMLYCMTSSAANLEAEGSRQSSETEFHAKSSWVLMRGNRYQVLEEEFFKFILRPHDEALLKAYGMDSLAIARGIQSLSDSIRTGLSDAVQKLFDGMEEAHAAMEGSDAKHLEEAIEKVKTADSDFATSMSGAMYDIFYGGICNMSKHTEFSAALLEDLSYPPGGNTDFFSDGEFRGTPMRTLPARIRPGIKLGNDYYITDGQFARDSAYRAIQRGLIGRLPEYREVWNERQKRVTEEAYPSIFAEQLSDARKFAAVYFMDPTTGAWVESDLIMVLADVLIIVEAKAGVQAMHSPATNFKSHERVIQNLIINAYEQCARFVKYLASAAEVPVFSLAEGKYIEVGRLRQRDFRVILPIGLTVETFTPFSAMCKELNEIQPILGKHPFVSMSVDDLFVLSRFLPTTGELIHYLEVRQAAAGIKRAMILDEIDHLGSYITDNRFDIAIKENLEKADLLMWHSFGDVVDKHFEGRIWETERPPHQEYPEELGIILSAMNKYRPEGWLAVDANIRNLGGNARDNLSEYLAELKQTLARFPSRRLLYGEDPLQVWICRAGEEPSADSMRYQGQVGSLLSKGKAVQVIVLSYDPTLEIVDARCMAVNAPTILQRNYPDLLQEAENQRGRLIPLRDDRRNKGKERR